MGFVDKCYDLAMTGEKLVVEHYHQKSINSQRVVQQTRKPRGLVFCQQPLQNRVSRVRAFLPLPRKRLKSQDFRRFSYNL